MTVLPPNILSYTGEVATPFISKPFPPTSAFNQFDVPTIWIDSASQDAYILTAKPGGVAVWVRIGGVPGDISQITTGDSNVIVPTAGNINFVNGNGVATTGAGSSATFNMASPFTGNFKFTGSNTAASYQMPSLQTPGSDAPIIQQSSAMVVGDGDVQLFSGNNISGLYYISWRTNGRDNYVLLAVKSLQFATYAVVNVLYNYGDVVFTNFRIYSVADNSVRTLVCNVANRNGGLGPIVICNYSDSGFNDTQFFPNNALTNPIVITGNWQQQGAICLWSWAKDQGTTSSSVAHSLFHETYSAGGNGIGVGETFNHRQADGTIVQGATLQTAAPAAGTNVQTTNFSILTNVAGVMTSQLVINNNGLSTNGTDFFKYAEGTWTPIVTFGGLAVGVTYGNQNGKYTRIGRFVHCNYLVSLTSKGSSTGVVQIGGLPFTVGQVNDRQISRMDGTTLTAGFTILATAPGQSTTTAFLVMEGSNQVEASLTDTQCSNTSAFQGTILFYI